MFRYLTLVFVTALATGCRHDLSALYADATADLPARNADVVADSSRGSDGSALDGASDVFLDHAAVDADAAIDSGPAIPLHLAAGEEHTCAVMTDGTVRCWGSNSNGQLGI